MSGRPGKGLLTPEYEENRRREAEEQRAEALRQAISKEPIPPYVFVEYARLNPNIQGFPASPPPPTGPALPEGSIHTSDIANMFFEPAGSSVHRDREEVQSSAARIPQPLVRLRRGKREPSGSGFTVTVSSTYYFI